MIKQESAATTTDHTIDKVKMIHLDKRSPIQWQECTRAILVSTQQRYHSRVLLSLLLCIAGLNAIVLLDYLSSWQAVLYQQHHRYQQQKQLQQQQQRQQQQQQQLNDESRQETLVVATTTVVADVHVLQDRKLRFPSVEERVKVYMSYWYAPPCGESNVIRYTYNQREVISLHDQTAHSVRLYYSHHQDDNDDQIEIDSEISRDNVFLLHNEKLKSCASDITDSTMKNYCSDTANTLLVAMDKLQWYQTLPPKPVLLQYGDADSYSKYARLPHIMKYRKSIDARTLTSVTEQSCWEGVREHAPAGIIWLLDAYYHYGKLGEVPRQDVPWDHKLPRAVFRGALTGKYGGIIDDTDRCLYMPRCRLVYTHNNSSLVNAKLTSTFGRVPDTLNGVALLGDKFSLRDHLQYKAIIILEGNDVGSGLKWALYSNSVVMMPPPTLTSFAMEELLQPWVHYIPISPDVSDVKEKVQWMVDNDEQAQYIARRGQLWIWDLMMHEDALKENLAANYEIMKRYGQHFVHA
jgi:Glycosyl transferase family 90